ncbi:receptor-like protein EIX2 [Silene latifolia]|uniref:receptor-like protein EIX2 n=1 Tax=Silene latifolia TaxID=37657 RepID=UPI003D7859EB
MNICHHLITAVLPWLILTCHLCHSGLSNSETSSVRCFDRERNALLQFKDGITQDYCGLLASWKDDTDCCQWHGVRCSNYTGHVTMLRLQGSEVSACIEGILSPFLSELEHLRHLDLSFNYFTPPIPSFLGSLTNLEYLNLGYAFETTQINMNISSGNDSYSYHMQNLKWLSHLHPLSHLDLSYNQLEGPVPNQLEGPVPNDLSNLHHLSYLDLSYNQLKGSVPNEFGKLHHLSHLGLSSNQLEGPVPNDFSKLHHLSYLDLSYNQLKGSVPYELNHFYGTIPDNISSLTMLRELYLGGNQISKISKGIIHVSFWNSLPFKLNYLNMSHNQFSGLIPPLVDLSNNFLSGKLPDCWMKFVALSSLHLENNRFYGSIPKSIGTLKNLQYLHLHNNSFSGPIPASLENCTSLAMFGNLELELNSGIEIFQINNFLGEIPASLCQLSNLQILDFAKNHILGVIPKCISNITANTSTGLYFAQGSTLFKGEGLIEEGETAIVTWKGEEQKFKDSLGFVDSLSYVKSIDFSFNELSGEIPDGIFNLTGLVSLDLSNNNMSGSVSSEIGQLTNLELLDLSGNHLTGTIPDSLAKLSSLAILDLSNNNLSGKIPIGTQLQSFDASSYTRNPGLCGAPLLKCPRDQAELNAPIGNNSSSVQEKHENYDLFLGLYISVVLGFIIGFWGVCGSLVIKRSWRHAWFRLIQDTHDRFYETSLGIIPQAWKKPRH